MKHIVNNNKSGFTKKSFCFHICTTFNPQKTKEPNFQTHLSDFSSAIPRTASENTSGVLMTDGGVPSLSVTKALMAVAGQRDEIDTPANKIYKCFGNLIRVV